MCKPEKNTSFIVNLNTETVINLDNVGNVLENYKKKYHQNFIDLICEFVCGHKKKRKNKYRSVQDLHSSSNLLLRRFGLVNFVLFWTNLACFG